MVRLKGRIKQLIYAKEKISIPYGAIKSISKSKLPNCCQIISIPYGAIKSRRHRLLKMA